MVSDGKVNGKDKRGNDHADRVADEGVLIHGKEMIQTGALLTGRHKKFANFETIHDHCLEAYHRKRYPEKKCKSKKEERVKTITEQTAKRRLSSRWGCRPFQKGINTKSLAR